jgi:hypothetical protein
MLEKNTNWEGRFVTTELGGRNLSTFQTSEDPCTKTLTPVVV